MTTKDSKKQTTSLSSLDSRYFYYQNPTSGDVSKTAVSLRQLCKMLVPFREGRPSVLAGSSKCVEIVDGAYGDWKTMSDVPVLREASLIEWQYRIESEEESITSSSAGSCRSLWLVWKEDKEKTIMVREPTHYDEWKSLKDIPELSLVLEALQPPAPLAPRSTRKDTGDEKVASDEVQDELEVFLSSTAREMKNSHENDEESYQSDGGTNYVKDSRTGNWIHEKMALHQPKETDSLAKDVAKDVSKNTSRKRKKAQFSKRNAKNWIYITGLPTENLSLQDVEKFFSRAGMMDLDPETLQPKIKLYQQNGKYKGDASICYARSESVELALQILDQAPWDEHHILTVQRAEFEAKDDVTKRKLPISQAKRKVAKLALLQAQDDGFGERLAGGRKGLRIVVVRHMMDGIKEEKLEQTVQAQCDAFGPVEKITCISATQIVIIKFVEPSAAADAVKAWNGAVNEHTKKIMEAIYWDGVTDYTTTLADEEGKHKEEEERHENFGKWLQQQEELPPELRLNVAED